MLTAESDQGRASGEEPALGGRLGNLGRGTPSGENAPREREVAGSRDRWGQLPGPCWKEVSLTILFVGTSPAIISSLSPGVSCFSSPTSPHLSLPRMDGLNFHSSVLSWVPSTLVSALTTCFTIICSGGPLSHQSVCQGAGLDLIRQAAPWPSLAPGIC